VSSITIVSEAPNCGITYDRHYDDRNSFIVQATAVAIYLSPDVIGLPAGRRASEAETIGASVGICRGQSEGSDPASGALLAFDVGLAEARPVRVALATAVGVALVTSFNVVS
jgi:hypothetical protein